MGNAIHYALPIIGGKVFLNTKWEFQPGIVSYGRPTGQHPHSVRTPVRSTIFVVGETCHGLPTFVSHSDIGTAWQPSPTQDDQLSYRYLGGSGTRPYDGITSF